MSRAPMDFETEKKVSDFLDKYFYSKLKSDEVISDFKRISIDNSDSIILQVDGDDLKESKLQLKGVDIIISKQNKNGSLTNSLIDEKCCIYFANDNIGTFSFELLAKGKEEQENYGWFIREDLKTEFYFLLWPTVNQELHDKYVSKDSKGHKRTEEKIELISHITPEDFTKFYGILIKKSKLKEALAEKGLSNDVLYKKAKEIRASKKTGRIDFVRSRDIFYYYYSSESSQYEEQPINILIKQFKLKELATSQYIIYKNRYKKF